MSDLTSGEELFVQPWGDLLEDERETWRKQIKGFNLPPLVDAPGSAEDQLDQAGISKRISSDPLLAGKVLAVANSASMGRAMEVASLEQAVVYLGANLVQTIIAAYRMEAVYRESGSYPRALFSMIQNRSVASSILAYNITAVVQRPLASATGTAALLSPIGGLVFGTLDNPLPPDYCRITSETTRLKQETSTWGITSPVLSGQFARHWGLPEKLCELLEESWEPLIIELQPAENSLAKVIIATANSLASVAVSSDRFEAWTVLGRSNKQILKGNLKKHDLYDRVIDACSTTLVQRELQMIRQRA